MTRSRRHERRLQRAGSVPWRSRDQKLGPEGRAVSEKESSGSPQPKKCWWHIGFTHLSQADDPTAVNDPVVPECLPLHQLLPWSYLGPGLLSQESLSRRRDL